jgi:hypothetical protein
MLLLNPMLFFLNVIDNIQCQMFPATLDAGKQTIKIGAIKNTTQRS